MIAPRPNAATPTVPGLSPALLDSIRVGSPCTASWEAMAGDDRRRFCGDCRLHVYDLSAMGRDEAESLLRSRDGRLCVRFSRRPDGRVVTDDCGRVRRAIRRRARAIRVAASALFAMFFPFAAAGCGREAPSVQGGIVPTMGKPVAPPDPVEMGDYCPPPDPGERIMGEVFVPPPETGTTTPPVDGAKDPGAR